MSVSNSASVLAFGVEPGHAPYRLRQARYEALAWDVAALATKLAASGSEAESEPTILPFNRRQTGRVSGEQSRARAA